MKAHTAYMMRHIAQHHFRMHDPDFVKDLTELLDLDNEGPGDELDLFAQFLSDVCNHALENCITD